jgi:hypothetical protein
MRPDLTRRQPLGIQRHDRLIEAGDAAGVLGHDLRLELTRPVSRDLQRDRPDLGQDHLGRAAVAVIPARLVRTLALLIAQMLTHLRVQGGLQHRLGDASQQPVPADQRYPLGLGPLDELGGQLDIQPRRHLPGRFFSVGHSDPSQPEHQLQPAGSPARPRSFRQSSL